MPKDDDHFLDIDPANLLFRLNSGKKLKPAEIRAVVDLLSADEVTELGSSVSFDDVYSLLLVLSRAKLKEHRHLIEKYLSCDDAFIASLALEILCVEWAETPEYLERLINFALGVPWDEENDLRNTAIKILGEHLYSTVGAAFKETRTVGGKAVRPAKRQVQVIAMLMSTLTDADQEPATRQAAYFSLCRAAGKDWEQIPSEFAQLDLSPESPDLDHEMLGQLSLLISSTDSSSS